MSPPQPVCRAIEPDLLSVAAGEADSAAAGRVEAHVGGCQLCRDELAHYGALEGLIDSLRCAPLADNDATLARAQLAALLSDLRSRVPRRRMPGTSGRVRRWPRAEAVPAGSGTLDPVKSTSRTGASRRLPRAGQKRSKQPRAGKERRSDMSATLTARPVGSIDIDRRVEAVDWANAATHLDDCGWARLAKLLTPKECETLAGLYEDDRWFRSHVVMARHGFGRGEYKYFRYPLPDIVADLRRAIYPKLVPTANRWNESMRLDVHYPDAHAEFIARCHKAGQTRPTPLLLQYAAGDFNALHQDLYGEHVFPLQLTILLSEPEQDFTGGEFVLTEQRPRMQSRAEVVPLRRGDAVVFAVHHRPVHGTRGTYRVNLRHGVSRLRSGHRHTVGVIFHDAK